MNINGETSDGYHTFNQLYDHRNQLFLALMSSHPDISWWSKFNSDGTADPGWIICGMDLPQQVTYHMPAKESVMNDLAHIQELPIAKPWDGHTPDQCLDRLRQICGYKFQSYDMDKMGKTYEEV